MSRRGPSEHTVAMSTLPRGRWVIGLALGALAWSGCTEERPLPEPPIVYADVAPILDASCLECHSGPEAAADYRVDDYFTTIRCIPDPEGEPATLPPTSPPRSSPCSRNRATPIFSTQTTLRL